MSSTPLHIWYISQYAAPASYGINTRHFYFSRAFEAAGHSCCVIASNVNHTAHHLPKVENRFLIEEIDGVKTCWVKGLEYRNPYSFRRFIGWLWFCWQLFFLPVTKIGRPDVLIVSSISPLPVLNALYYKWKWGCRLIFEVRDIWPLVLTTLGGKSALHPLVLLLQLVEKLAYRFSDGVVGTMPGLAKHVRNIVKKAPPVCYIPHAVESNYLEPKVESKSPESGYFLVGYAGAMGSANELEDLLEAARILDNKQIPVRFQLIGDGPMKSKWQELASDLPYVEFLPKVSKEELPGYLAQCDLLYDGLKSSSLYEFGTSRNKWIDYLLAAKPILLTYDGHEKGWLKKIGCGLCVEPGFPAALAESIRNFSEMPEEARVKIGARGFRYLTAERSVMKLASRYLHFIQTVTVKEEENRESAAVVH